MHLSVSVPMHVCTLHFATMSDKQWHLGRSATCDNVLHRLQETKTTSGSLHSLQEIKCLFFHQKTPTILDYGHNFQFFGVFPRESSA